MDAERLTTRASQAVSAAFTRATVDGSASVEPVHLLLALLAADDLTCNELLQQVGTAPAELTQRASRLAEGQPKVSGSTVPAPQPSRGFVAVLAVADQEATKLGDSYVGTAHLLFG